MLHFRYFFTEIQIQTSSLILFGARSPIIFKKKKRQACKPQRHVFTVVRKREKVSIL